MTGIAVRTDNAVLNKSNLVFVIYCCTIISVVGLIFSIAVSSIAMGIAIVLLLYYFVTSGLRSFSGTSLDLFFFCYAVVELLASVFSVEPSASFFNMKRLFLISFVYLVLVSVNDKNKFLFILGLLIGVTSLLSFFEIFSLTSLAGRFMRVSLFQYYLTEGGIKMISLLLLLPLLLHSQTPRSWKIWGTLMSLPIFIALILTQTRSAWLALIGGICTIAVLKNWKIIFVLVAILILFMLFAPADFRNRAVSIVDLHDKSNMSRLQMISTGWKMFLDHPVFGIGDIDLKKIYVTYVVPLDEGEGGHLHNNIMMLLVTLGIVGSIATTALFIRLLQVELRTLRATRTHWLYGSVTLGCIAAYVGFHINGLFEWNFGDHEIAVLLWFSVGIALVSERLYKHDPGIGENER